ncbi:FMRFamide receptor-like isoform X1 [Haliotis rubra]|uniref:FMRFamide receptor-like isoform X1 n=1 Tax=Haliotis rubra TaxID=36100 RepID=UPI001EE5E67E|nr:FMRFamide receptor-like isoform X1 [Haliotis rubra]
MDYNSNNTVFPDYDNGSDAHTMLKVAIYINNYYLWVIFAVGFPGNIASVITIFRMQRVTTSTFYVAVLAVTDCCAIVFKLTYHQLTLHEVTLDSVGCKMLNFFMLNFATCANWILVCITTERFVAVRNPLKVGMYWTVPRAVFSVATIGCVVALFYCHILWTYTGSGIFCAIHPQYIHFFRNAWYWMDAVVYSIGPCVILTTLNCFIIHSVKQSTTLRNQLSMKRKQKKTSSGTIKQDAQITMMLISVSIVFVILTVPRCIFVIINMYWDVKLGTIEDAQKYLMDQLTFLLCDSTHAINFYLYFITGKKFRNNFLDMVLCRKPRMLTRNLSQSGTTVTMQTKYKSNSLDDGQTEDEI